MSRIFHYPLELYAISLEEMLRNYIRFQYCVYVYACAEYARHACTTYTYQWFFVHSKNCLALINRLLVVWNYIAWGRKLYSLLGRTRQKPTHWLHILWIELVSHESESRQGDLLESFRMSKNPSCKLFNTNDQVGLPQANVDVFHLER